MSKFRGYWEKVLYQPTRVIKNQQVSIPQEPAEGSCCMSGCRTCVWDDYFEQCEKYRKETGTEINFNESVKALREMEMLLNSKQ